MKCGTFSGHLSTCHSDEMNKIHLCMKAGFGNQNIQLQRNSGWLLTRWDRTYSQFVYSYLPGSLLGEKPSLFRYDTYAFQMGGAFDPCFCWLSFGEPVLPFPVPSNTETSPTSDNRETATHCHTWPQLHSLTPRTLEPSVWSEEFSKLSRAQEGPLTLYNCSPLKRKVYSTSLKDNVCWLLLPPIILPRDPNSLMDPPTGRHLPSALPLRR